MSEKLEKKDVIDDEIATFLKRCDENGNSLLHYVVQSDYNIFAEQLIISGCDVNEKNHFGDPPLIIAIRENKLEMVKLLLEAGVDYSIYHFTDTDGPLHVAARWGCPEIVQLFIEMGADVNAQNESTQTVLHCANICVDENKWLDNCKVIETLIKAGAEVNAKEYNGRQPIFYAVMHKFHAGFEKMLIMGADIETKKKADLLHYAADNGDCYILKRLLELGYDVNMTDVFGDSCLHSAASSGESEAIEFLINNGAKFNINDNGLDPLCYALLQWRYDYENLSESNDDHDQEIEKKYCKAHAINMKCLETLIKAGTNVNHVTNDGLTPLYIVLDNYMDLHSDFARVLLKTGAKLDFDHPSVRKLINTSNVSKFSHLLLKHTAMFEAQNRNDGPEHFNLIELNEELRKDYARCRDELELMKVMKINETNVSFFNVLANEDIGPYTRNECIRNVFETSFVSKRFPIYSDVVLERFFKELKFQTLVNQATDSLGRILGWDRDSMHMLLSNILHYLDEKDLNCLASL